jgi:hypothetical protein
MKISEIKQCDLGQELQQAKPSESASAEFNRLLAEETGKLSETAGAVGGGTQLGALSSVMPFQLAPVLNDFSDDYQQAELAVEGAIYRIESLQSALQNPGAGLRSVGAAIDGLTAGVGELQQKVACLPENHLLRQMADELAVMAHVESVKYRRGDYL